MSLAQALQNKTITRLVIVPERLDVGAELKGLPAKFSLERCFGSGLGRVLGVLKPLQSHLQLLGSRAHPA